MQKCAKCTFVKVRYSRFYEDFIYIRKITHSNRITVFGKLYEDICFYKKYINFISNYTLFIGYYTKNIFYNF